MSEENRDMEIGGPEPDIRPSVGGQLKAARESREMSVGDIAMALKLGQRQVEALESGDWGRLPGHTFIRGFVRNYARLLQIDATPLMAQLDAVLETPQQRLVVSTMEGATMPQAGRTRRRDFMMALAGLGVALIAIVIYFLLPADLSSVRDGFNSLFGSAGSKEEAAPAVREEPVFPPGTTPQEVLTPQAVDPARTEPDPAAPALVPPPVQSPMAPPALQPPAAQPPAAQPPAAQPPARQAPASQAPAVPAAPVAAAPAVPPAAAAPATAPLTTATLRMVFEQESWVEVRDRNGNILTSARYAAGTERNISGQGPFALVIGNAPGVKLSLRGQPVELKPYTGKNVARLTLE